MGRIADLRRKATTNRRHHRGGGTTAYPSPQWGCSTCGAELADVLVLIGVPSGELVHEALCWACFDPVEYPGIRYEVFPGRPPRRQQPNPRR